MTIRNRRLFFLRGPWHGKARSDFPSRLMLRAVVGGENPRLGGQFKTRPRCIVEYLRGFQATEGSTKHSPLVFGVGTALWSTTTKRGGKWYRGVIEAAKRFMVNWHEDEAQLSRQRRESGVDGAQGNGGRWSNRRSGRKPDQGNGGKGGQQEKYKGYRGGRK